MDKVSQQYFDNIIKKNIGSLTEPEKVFLRARRGYLKPHQLEEYKDILKAKAPEPEVVDEPSNLMPEPPTYLSNKELKAKAEGLKIDTKGKSREEIEDLIKAEENK
jgi:hypothetical protein